MAHRPILRPDDSENSPLRAGQAEDETIYSLNELANTFVAHGAGVISADLALDLVLHDIVRQACLATGASGAAVALLRDGEMVCRASSGAAAPDLGVRLDTRAGIAGVAVQSGEMQSCPDTASDPRVEPETCRRGILSIVMLPLLDEGEVFGIFEVLFPRVNAFGELDVITIQALAQQIVHNRRQAHQTTGRLEMGLLRPETGLEEDPMHQVPPVDSGIEPELSALHEETAPTEGDYRVEKPHSRQTDFWTAFLAVLVIGTVVLMALLIGWRLGWTRAAARQRRGSPNSRMERTETAAARSAAPASQLQASSPTPTASETLAATNAASPPVASSPAKAPAAPPVGGLVVYEKGKVIFRLPPSAPEQLSHKEKTGTDQEGVVLASKINPDPAKIDQQSAEARLVHRVAPQYPAEARRDHIQGSVVLKAEIGRKGEVQKLTVLQGDPALTESAVKAIRQWRYRPYLVNGHPVEMQTTITVNFSLPAE